MNSLILILESFFESKEFVFAVLGALGTIGAAVVTYFATRRKNLSELDLTGSQTRKTDAETLAAAQEKISTWIDRFETAKLDVLATEEELADIKRDLNDCLDKSANCTQLKSRIQTFFLKLESILTSAEHTDLLRELRELIYFLSK